MGEAKRDITFLVDVDNILWEFGDTVYSEIIKMDPTFPFPEDWNEWNIFSSHGIRGKVLTDLFDRVHERQCDYPPFPGARTLLRYLYGKGTVIIASHRSPYCRPQLEEWLNENKLLYHEIHVSNDKTVLMDRVDAVIDDRPDTLDAAMAKGKVAVGLRWPWNCKGPYVLFDDLYEITAFLRGKYGEI